ncbi:hypothetical protein BDAP_002524 [Binucleata daphniae]
MSKIRDTEIQNLISNKEYEKAQLLINALEDEFYCEKSKYGQKVLKERIANLKKLLLNTNKIEINEDLQTMPRTKLQKDLYNLESQTMKDEPTVESINTKCNKKDIVSETNNDIHTKNEDGKTNNDINTKGDIDVASKTKSVINTNNITETNKNLILPNCLSQVIFCGCKNITTQYFECTDSVYIKDTQDSQFTFSAKQIRLVNCKKIVLEIHTKTGVFLENCSEIQIKGIEEKDNMYKNVRDFTNPFSNTNYSITE